MLNERDLLLAIFFYNLDTTMLILSRLIPKTIHMLIFSTFITLMTLSSLLAPCIPIKLSIPTIESSTLIHSLSGPYYSPHLPVHLPRLDFVPIKSHPTLLHVFFYIYCLPTHFLFLNPLQNDF